MIIIGFFLVSFVFLFIEFQYQLKISHIFNKKILKILSFPIYGYDLLIFILYIMLSFIQYEEDIIFIKFKDFKVLEILNIAFVILGLYGVYISFLQFIVSFTGGQENKFLGRSKSVVIIEQNPYIQITRKFIFSFNLILQLFIPLVIYFYTFKNKEMGKFYDILMVQWQSSLIILSVLFILLIIKNIDIPINTLMIHESVKESKKYNEYIFDTIEKEFTRKLEDFIISESNSVKLKMKFNELITNNIQQLKINEVPIFLPRIINSKYLLNLYKEYPSEMSIIYKLIFNEILDKDYITGMTNENKNIFIENIFIEYSLRPSMKFIDKQLFKEQESLVLNLYSEYLNINLKYHNSEEILNNEISNKIDILITDKIKILIVRARSILLLTDIDGENIYLLIKLLIENNQISLNDIRHIMFSIKEDLIDYLNIKMDEEETLSKLESLDNVYKETDDIKLKYKFIQHFIAIRYYTIIANKFDPYYNSKKESTTKNYIIRAFYPGINIYYQIAYKLILIESFNESRMWNVDLLYDFASNLFYPFEGYKRQV